jgi:hypothetical protein
MPDISMCHGGSCILRLHCHRYTAIPEPLGQSYFGEPPYKMEFMFDDNHDGFGVATVGCAYFWNNAKRKKDEQKPKNN